MATSLVIVSALSTLYIRLIARSPLEFVTLLPSHLHTAPQSKMNTVINLSKSIVFSHDLNNRKTNETSSHSNLKKCESLLTRVRCEQHCPALGKNRPLMKVNLAIMGITEKTIFTHEKKVPPFLAYPKLSLISIQGAEAFSFLIRML